MRLATRRLGVDEAHDVRERVVEEVRLDLRFEELHPRERRLLLRRVRPRLVARGARLRPRRALARDEDRNQDAA